ncbi:MAG TPA: D-alanine--D-alanine ligase family protein [Chloroflexota bacterium]
MSKLRIGVIYGSRSVEHEVSVITALQAMAALDSNRYEVIPLFLTKEGKWLTGDALRKLDTYQATSKARKSLTRAWLSPVPGQGALQSGERSRFLPFGGGPDKLAIDVAFPCVHGTFGEDGTLQGLLELADVPYVGPGVLAAALGMDKLAMKAVFRSAGLPIVDWVMARRDEWTAEPDRVIERVEQHIGYPAFVKPANLGSSVGISKATDRDTLRQALEVAAHFDRRLLVEKGLDGAVDIQCSVLGRDGNLKVSVCEQPVSWESFYSYDEKYIRGGKTQGMKGATRRIPAPISEKLTQEIQCYAMEAFQAIDSAGVARIDCLLTPDEQVYVNEINTIPGSLSFYLWEATDLPFRSLLDELIEIALARHAERKQTTFSIDSALLRKTLEGSGKARR